MDGVFWSHDGAISTRWLIVGDEFIGDLVQYLPRADVFIEIVKCPFDNELFGQDASGECDDLDAISEVRGNVAVDLGDEEDLLVHQTGG